VIACRSDYQPRAASDWSKPSSTHCYCLCGRPGRSNARCSGAKCASAIFADVTPCRISPSLLPMRIDKFDCPQTRQRASWGRHRKRPSCGAPLPPASSSQSSSACGRVPAPDVHVTESSDTGLVLQGRQQGLAAVAGTSIWAVAHPHTGKRAEGSAACTSPRHQRDVRLCPLPGEGCFPKAPNVDAASPSCSWPKAACRCFTS